tara:strand:+ start:40 stop:252 length:213 start_codon:yes stop_codon:yes gene_type:complete
VFQTKYRIISDEFAGYECQFRYFWMPFYLQMNFPSCNTHFTLHEAKNFIENGSVEKKKFVLYYGTKKNNN